MIQMTLMSLAPRPWVGYDLSNVRDRAASGQGLGVDDPDGAVSSELYKSA